MLIFGNNIINSVKKYAAVIVIVAMCFLISVVVWYMYHQRISAIDDRINNVGTERVQRITTTD